jgi:hypothetical protein
MRTVKNRKTTEEDSIKNTHPHTVLKKLVSLEKSKKEMVMELSLSVIL